MENRGRGRLRGVAVLAALAAVAVTAAVWTGSSAASSKKAVDTNPFAHYGKITLNVWSADNQDPGLEPVIKALGVSFSKKYPNVTIKTRFYSLTPYLKILKLSLASSKAPDVAEGNQGFGTDSLLVKAKLIVNMDPYVKKYGWDKYYPPSVMQQYRWTADGKTYGKGSVWGVGQAGQSVGVFYNKALLKKYGGNPDAMPKTFDGFNKLLATVRAKAPASVPVIELGNKDGYESLHDFGMVQGAYVTGQYMRNWIFHVPGSTYLAPDNTKALALFQKWAKDNYFGNDYNALIENDAAAAFAKGKGVFYLGGDWQAQVIQTGLKDNVAFMNMPPGTERQARGNRRDELALARLVEFEVSRCRCGFHQLARRRPRLGEADVRPEPDSRHLDGDAPQGQPVPEVPRRWLEAALHRRRPHALPRLGIDQHVHPDGNGVPEDDGPAAVVR
jgi:raffinose/stachyose/melibiose transport system substrate-binding protein